MSTPTEYTDFACWVTVMPTLSTGHIKATTEAVLAQSEDWMVASYEYGFFLYIEQDLDDLIIPDELVPIIAWFEQWQKPTGEESRWIRFDQCGDYIEGLPEYDW